MNFKQTVKLSHFEGGLYALMVASTESFLFYYAVKQNVTSFELAILASLPLALGALSQMFIPKLIKDYHLGSSVVWAMLVQILGVLGILYTVAVNYTYDKLLFFTCIHFIGGLTSSPLWIDWASKIIPKRNFRKYMASRSSYTWYLILVFYLGLALLSQFTSWFKLVYIFLIGATARILSCALQYYIIRGTFSVELKTIQSRKINEFPQVMSSEIVKIIWLFIICTSLFRFAIYISSPFFTPYMMNDLKLSMFQFVLLSSIPYFGRALFFNYWGKVGKGFGAFFGIGLTGLYISIIPIIWVISRNYNFLIFSEILAGIAWGGFELNQVLMIQNFMHQSMKVGSRVLLGIHMALANICGVLGAIVGSLLMDAHLSFYQIFLCSSILRFLAILILIKLAFFNKNKQLGLKQIQSYLKNLLPL